MEGKKVRKGKIIYKLNSSETNTEGAFMFHGLGPLACTESE
jgi:hypothetical protein